MVPFCDPVTHEELVLEGSSLVGVGSRQHVADVVDGIPRFVPDQANYAEDNFGWMWKRWDTLGGTEEALRIKAAVIAERTGFTKEMLDGRTLLECGGGRGDDTRVLLDFPLAELHSFELTTAVDVAASVIGDDRLQLSQASITQIPYDDESFDIVYCHRVLQHTPDPVASLRSICRKVKPGGILFAHCYKRSLLNLNLYKYKYRPLTKRMTNERVSALLDRYGERLHQVHERTRDVHPVFAHVLMGVVPLARILEYGDFDREKLIELSKLVTFDALTPTYDRPMSSRRFRSTIEDEGFVIEHLLDPRTSPICARARRAA